MRDVDIGTEYAGEETVTDHLVVYEYGTGAVWGYVRAGSADEISQAVPELDVYQGAPPWLTPEDLASLRAGSVALKDGEVVDRLMHR